MGTNKPGLIGKLSVAIQLRPAAWSAPVPAGLCGPYATNRVLAAAERWDTGAVGPEDVVVADDGSVYAGVEDGRVLRLRPGQAPEVAVRTHGRPLGIELDGEGRLIICDARRGLLRAAPGGRLECLCDSYRGEPFRFTNNAAVARDGTIYFTDSSRYSIQFYRADLIAHRPWGRLFALEPGAREPELLLDGLYFANGVALSSDESFVAVAETSAYRIARLWLRGARAGQRDLFVDNLPGFPDNLSSNGRGTIWAAFPSPRNGLLDALAPRPRLRHAIALLPEVLQPQPTRHGLVLGFDESGEVTHNLQDDTGQCALLTGVREHAGQLYLGSLYESTVARWELPSETSEAAR